MTHISMTHIEPSFFSTSHTVSTLAEFSSICQTFAATLVPGNIVLLYGDMGAGKTTFVQECGAVLGIAKDTITSPTFSLIHTYSDGPIPVYHMDLYRLNSSKEIALLGLDEVFDNARAISFVEWAERLETPFPYPAKSVHLALRHDSRIMRFSSSGVM